MILILGGTSDGRKLGRFLQENQYSVLITTVSEYGKSLVEKDEAADVVMGPLTERSLQEMIETYHVSHLIDATHPYAQVISQLARTVAAAIPIPYIRYQRPATDYHAHPLIQRVPDLDAALQLAGSLGENIFCTLGIKMLPQVKTHPALQGKRLVVRVLPDVNSLKCCKDLGLKPPEIVAMQGPFSHELNKALLEHYQSHVLLTKDSGAAGGTDTKISAALDLGIHVIMLARPDKNKGIVCHDFPEILNHLA
ncbi:MAG: precorrin-6A reductase [Bacillota bacterium]|uniref:Precorrin-6A reductase n=1 Tax=Thermanaerosceptrum fracticalcis TaxID=1712410 RepID=A0A7G6E0R8_THEFR|nr:precorrin-6A reductase [Thermanaerosceptrum fracticalcis]QNB45672.1 precorrin-6A reductase [Thermanaerosceptrum fracticalcis]